MIIDTAISTMNDFFDVLNGKFYADPSLLDPLNFDENEKLHCDINFKSKNKVAQYMNIVC